jgi:redox-sensing transcriptional repressor
MKKNKKISNAVIRRLPRYRRYLIELSNNGVDKVSSEEFSRLIGYTASQIRQDLNNFGGFGQQGYGYRVDALLNEISMILGLDREYKVVVAGAGNLGQAIINYIVNFKAGFVIERVFEINPKLIGKRVNGIEIMDYEHLQEYVKGQKIDLGVICTMRDSAQDVADKLAKAGVKGIWNFAPVDLDVDENIAVENVHLSDSLHFLSYHIVNL